jgi:hypothetical protein
MDHLLGNWYLSVYQVIPFSGVEQKCSNVGRYEDFADLGVCGSVLKWVKIITSKINVEKNIPVMDLVLSVITKLCCCQ